MDKEIIKEQIWLTVFSGVIPVCLTWLFTGKDSVISAVKAAKISDEVSIYFGLVFLLYISIAWYWYKLGEYHFDNVLRWKRFIDFLSKIGSSLSGFFRIYATFSFVAALIVFYEMNDWSNWWQPVVLFIIAMMFFSGLVFVAWVENEAKHSLDKTMPK